MSHITSIDMAPVKATIVPDESRNFVATGHFANGASHRLGSAVWDTSDHNVATIVSQNGAGAATGHHVGTTTVTAALDGVTGSATLDVATVSSVTVTPASNELAPTMTKQLTAIAHFSDGASRTITNSAIWHSSNTAAVLVNRSGGVYARNVASDSTSTVTANWQGRTGSATVKVAPVSSIAVTPSSIQMNPSDRSSSRPRPPSDDGHVVGVTHFASWSSDDSETADVSTKRSVTAGFGSSTTVRADLDGQEGTCDVSVNDEG